MKNIIGIDAGIPQIIEDDPWEIINDTENIIVPNKNIIFPLAQWQDYFSKAISENNQNDIGVWLGPGDDVGALVPLLHNASIIAIQFPNFRDGRGYSQAYVLRTRFGWRGELRAFGDVLRDQLSHMRQCGFTSFAVRADKSVEDAVKGLAGIGVSYARSAVEPEPLFRRRT